MPENSKSDAQKVRGFHLASGGAAPESLVVPDEATLALRRALIGEEMAEVRAVFERLAKDGRNEALLARLAHELSDLLYVIYGTFVACGIDADEVFAEVHRANMEKIGDSLRLREDGKLLKPDGWQPANVIGVIEQQRERDF